MTMKKQKTLQHIATVAVVLLTLCLVFMIPGAAAIADIDVAKISDTGILPLLLQLQQQTQEIL